MANSGPASHATDHWTTLPIEANQIVFRNAMEGRGNWRTREARDSVTRTTGAIRTNRGGTSRLAVLRFAGVVAMAHLALHVEAAGQSAGQTVIDLDVAFRVGQPILPTRPEPIRPRKIASVRRLKPTTALSVDIRPQRGKLPEDHATAAFNSDLEVLRPHSKSSGLRKPFLWEAPATCHRPLYFENVNLERHGHSFGVAQPIVSAGHLACSTVILPYRMVAEPRTKPIYTLGHVRPDTPTPFQVHWPPPATVGGLAEGALIVGLLCLIP